jgi:hypothetical protein
MFWIFKDIHYYLYIMMSGDYVKSDEREDS